jgi:hypothetical protein
MWDGCPPIQAVAMTSLAASPAVTALDQADNFALGGLLVCDGCEQRLYPVGLVGGNRAYANICGCRLRPVDADTIEAIISRATHRHLGHLDGDASSAGLGVLFRRLLTMVRVGGCADEVICVWRT